MKGIFKTIFTFLVVATLAGCGAKDTTNPDQPTEKETFVVGMEVNYPPFNWQTTKETETSYSIGGVAYADGYDVQVAKKIADELGMTLEIKKISWDGLQPALQAGEIDAIIAGMTADETREQGIDFTTPYYDSEGMIMIVRKDSEMASFTDIQQFSGLTVVGQKGTNYDTVIDQIEGVNHAVPKNTYPEMIVALRSGDVDGITAERAVAEGVIAANPDLTIIEFEEGKGFEYDTTVSIGLKEGSRGTEFFNNVQAALDKISLEERADMMANAVKNQPSVN